MKNHCITLYAHAGSGNHGCEALANTICRLVDRPIRLITNSVEEDERYSLLGKGELIPERQLRENRLLHILYYGWRLLTGDKESFLRYRFRHAIGKNLCAWNLSIGGDNYCYDAMINDMMLSNSMFNRQGAKTILFGCSLEPGLLEREDIRQDMERYAAVFARESLTYEALRQAGVKTRLFLYPDSAFMLESVKLPLPEGFLEGNTVGVNISPMIMEQETHGGITLENYRALVAAVLQDTQMSVALIPHVVWERSNDLEAIARLYQYFRGEPRVVCIGDHNAEELKGYIARCRFFIGARTHATIAAYSSCVPTLAVGYSVKAKGIAADLFGSWENYVVPVQGLEEKEELLHAFGWMTDNEQAIKRTLEEVMPAYIRRVEEGGKKLGKILEET